MSFEVEKMSQTLMKSLEMLDFLCFYVDFAVFKTPFSNFSGQNLKKSLDSSNLLCLPWLLKLWNILNQSPKSWNPLSDFCLGVVHKLRWQIFGLFWPPSPLAVNVVCERPHIENFDTRHLMNSFLIQYIEIPSFLRDHL